MGQVTLLGFRQPGQLDSIGGTGGQVLGLDGEFQYGTGELVSLDSRWFAKTPPETSILGIRSNP